ncbi:hypothetical protein QYF61_022402 [Mycteria americana]|uniref:Uncharacterized protein n=3 Tax=Neoaves TaxID=3078114 RepID=A0AAN7MHA6_MYCAM|nr:hypothetical protein QYF61_022402 [Mycteria americana]
MSCYDQCQPCQPCGPTPLANSCNEPCVRQCQNSTVVIQPSPVVVTLPGPILSSFPQNTVVGSSTSAAVGSILSCDGVPITSGCCDLSCITSRYCGSRRVPLGLRQCRATIKGSPALCSLIHFSRLLLLGNQVHPWPRDMSCYDQCQPCQPCGPTPLANSCNEPCVRQCQNSTVVIQPSPVVVTLPGPILSSFPQNTVVGSSTSAAVGSILSCDGVPITSGCCDLSCITSRYCGSRRVPLGLRQCRATIKGSPALCSLIHFSRLLLLGNQVHPWPRDMSCYDQCQPCQPCGPTPLANSCNEPCVRQCQPSTVVIEPSPVVVILPGPILSSFPQNTVVGSSTSAAVGSILSCNGVPITSGCCDLSCITSRYCGSRRVPLGLRQCRATIKGSPALCSLIHFSRLLLLGNQVHPWPRDMSCYDQCQPCQPCGPTPLANSCNEPCVRQCQPSTVVIEPSPVVVILPGPILSSFPQNTVVGSSTSAAVGSILSCNGVPITSGCCDLSCITSRYCGSRRVPLGLRQCRATIKGSPALCSLIHFSRLLLLGNQVHPWPRDMSCYDQCQPCQPCGPTPLANSCNEPCVRQCQNSTVVIQPSPVVVTLPGPILSSFPQNTVVGSSTSAAVGSILSCDGVPITSGCCDLSCITSRYCGSRRVPLGLRQCRATIKGSPALCSLIHFSRLLLLGNQVHPWPRDMSCYDQCQPCQPCGPTPLANSCNEPCVRQCQNSTVVIQPSPVVVTLPGPILSSFPQNTVVGSSTSAAVGSILSCDGVPITSGCCDLSCITSRYCGSRRVPLGLRQCRATIKGSPALCSLIHFSRLLLLGNQVHPWPRDMSCYDQCQPCQPCGPTPLANSCNEPCVRQCQPSTVVIEPSPVVVILPGPILSSFPQNTVVGSSTSAAVGSILSCNGVPITSGCCDLSCITSRYCGSRRVPLGLRQCRATIKGSPALCSLIHFSRLLLLGNQVHPWPRDMSCYDQCQPCQPCGPTPLANSCNEPCVRQCQNSTVVIQPSPVVVTLPGPILSSFPQNTVVGSSTSAAVGSILSCDGVPITSGCCDLSCITSRYCGSRRVPLGLRQCRATIKGSPALCSLIHFSRLLLLGNQVHPWPRDMSCYDQCQPCQPCGPTPLANSCNEPCVRQCQNSTVVIQPSPVVVTLPGPILSSFPQNTVVGSSTSAAVGSILSCDGVPITSGCCDLSCITSRYCGSRRVPLGLRQCRATIKGSPALCSLIHFSRLLLLGNQVHPWPRDMSCYDQCQPCQPCGPTPLANSCNEPCVRQCQNSTVVIQPSPVVVTLPGPILSSFPQNTVVGSSTSAAVGSILSCDGVPITSGCCDLSCITSRYCGSRRVPLGLRQCRATIKGSPALCSLIHFSRLLLLGNQVHPWPRDMSCYDQCQPCQPCGPTPLANSCNEPCVRQCQNSTVVIQPSPVVVTLPGPILSSFPQNTVVGSSTSAAVGSILSCDGVPITSGCCDLSCITSRYCGSRRVPLGLRQCRATIKGSPALCSLIHFSRLLLLGNQVHPWPRDMSCYDQCQPCQPCGPTPLANSCNEPCVRQCQNSTVVIQPSPVVVTLPGPILSSFPQNTVVGSSTSAAVGSILSCDGVPITSGCCDLSCITSRYCGSRRCPPC